MNALTGASAYLQPPFEIVPDYPLERRRLQCYLALMVVDICAIVAGFYGAGWLYLGQHGMHQTFLQAQLLMPVFLTVGLYNGAYSIEALQRVSIGLIRVLGAFIIATAVLIFIAFYTKSSVEFSRVAYTLGVAFGALLLAASRMQMRSFVRWRCGGNVISKLLIDDGGPDIDFPEAKRIRLVQFSLNDALNDPVLRDRMGQILSSFDRVIVSSPIERRAAWANVLKGVGVSGEVLDQSVAELGAIGARVACGHGLLTVSVGPLGMRGRVLKRIFDLIVTGAVLFGSWPILLAVALAIKLEDGRPILFVQQRVGRSNKFIRVFKFRSMRAEQIDSTGARSASRDDDRITRIGRFIRRTSIDELPQLINVIKGEMSLVGPRPHALGSQAGDKLFWEADQRYWQRHALKPGMTGLAQVRGLRGATEKESDLTNRVSADLEYLVDWSIWRDVSIIVRTVRVLVHHKAF